VAWAVQIGFLVGGLSFSCLEAQSTGVGGGSGLQGASVRYGHFEILTRGDQVFALFRGYFRLSWKELKVSAEEAVLTLDRDEYQNLIGRLRKKIGPPKRGWLSPVDQKKFLNAAILKRLETMGIGGLGEKKWKARASVSTDRLLRLAKGIFAAGHVVVEQGGIHIFRAKSFSLSLDSDRMRFEDLTIRLPRGKPPIKGQNPFILRCEEAVEQGKRLVARKAVLTTCVAGKPHFDIASKKLIVFLHKDVTEFQGLGNSLSISGLPPVPLPNYHYYSNQETWIPLKGFRAGVTDRWGEFVFPVFGGRWNDLGQAVVRLFGEGQGRFEGEWRLRTGWSRKRGSPFDGTLTYRYGDLWQGEVNAFYLDDQGHDRRAMRRQLDGTPIRPGDRGFLRTKNRIHLDENLQLDLKAFQASDPASYVEFRASSLHEEELPETSFDLKYSKDNLLARVTARANLQDFNYNDASRLTPKFLSERPYGRLHLFSQPLTELGEQTPLVLDLSTGAGLLRNRFDDHAPASQVEQSFRLDAEVELSVPFVLGDFSLRPYSLVRDTWYSERPGGQGGNRKVFEVGAAISTRFEREFGVESSLLRLHGLRHEIIPEIRVFHRFLVDREPGDFFQFDQADALDELSAVDFGVLQRLLTVDVNGKPYEWMWLDLTQRIHPNSQRDNGGDRLGIFAFEWIFRPSRTLRFLVEGERDWNRGDFKTRNIGMTVEPVRGWTLAGEWRSGLDRDGEGSIATGVQFWQRWSVNYGTIYDFDLSRFRTSSIALVRRDHDWSLVFRFDKDQIVGDTRYFIQFLPNFLGIGNNGPSYIAGDPAFGVRNTTLY
jgi:hypothetical protein